MIFYDLLLRLYPASFRNEYGPEMRAVFARERRNTAGPGIPALWLRTITDIVVSSAAVHADVPGRARSIRAAAVSAIASSISPHTAEPASGPW